MKPEQLEIVRLKLEAAKLKAERDILKLAAANFANESLCEVLLHCQAPGQLGRGQGSHVFRGLTLIPG
jgi:hypothetical protein